MKKGDYGHESSAEINRKHRFISKEGGRGGGIGLMPSDDIL